MAYVRLDDQIASHPKVLRAGAEAAWLWACAIAYCNRQLTDGHVPAPALATMGAFRTPVKRLAATLVSVGLFKVDGDGYRVHDYLSHNPDKGTVQQRMREASQRKAASRGRASHAPVAHMSQRDIDETRLSPHARATRGTRTDSPPTPTPTPEPQGGGSVPERAALRAVPPLPSAPPMANDAWQEAIADWNRAVADVPELLAVSTAPASRQRIVTALRQCPDLGLWQRRFERVARSAFLRGGNHRAWVADFWWCLEHGDEIDAGRYDDRVETAAPATPPKRSPWDIDPAEAVAQQLALKGGRA